MDHVSRSIVAAEHPLPSRRPAERERARIAVLIYSLAAGAISVMAGAAASLAASGSGRIVLWSAATCACGIAAGIAYESRLLRFCYSALGRRIRQHARPSLVS